MLGELAELAAAVTSAAAAEGLRPAGLALAVPGLVGDRPGVVEHAPNLGWQRLPVASLLAASLAERLPAELAELPLVLDNEANLGALAELWRGVGNPDMIHISAEAGIGAALLVDGRLFRGARGFAGELGHVPVYPDGERCACGARGCLEQYAGLAAVLRAAGAEQPDDGVARLARRAAAGDGAVVAALDQAGRALGTALAGAVNLMDPAAVVLGGAYAELADWLLPAVRSELAARVTVRPWSAEAVLPSALGRSGPLVGAALLTVRQILEDPAALTAH